MSLVKRVRRPQQGDTIIEVMLAITVFALVAVMSIGLMNRGIAVTQQSLEITQVRQEINDQAELLRFVQQESFRDGGTGYGAVWQRFNTGGGTGLKSDRASSYGALTPTNRCPVIDSSYHPFILDPKAIETPNRLVQSTLLGDGHANIPPFPQLIYSGGVFRGAYGIWIESVPKTEGGTDFIDFHIRACWDGAGSDRPTTLGTIVRLYEKS